MRKTILLITVLCVALFAATIRAQEYSFQSYLVRDGLPSNYITALCQDARGYLWIGTDNGLSVYDGTEFKNFTTTDGLPNLFITDIIEQRGKHGSMWIGTIAGGIVKFEGGVFTSIPVGDNSVAALYEDISGTLWCSTPDRVFQVEHGSASAVAGIPGGGYEIHGLGDSVVVLLGRSEILFYHLQNRTIQKQPLNLAAGEFTSPILVDSDGIIWTVTSTRRLGRISADRVSFHELNSTFTLSPNLPSRIIDDGRGSLWVTYPGGILRVDKATYTSTILRGPGKAHTILSGPIILDREENVWIGTTGDGLLKLADQQVLYIPLGQVSSNSFNLAATTDSSGHIWILTYTGLWEVYRSNSGEWKKHRHISESRSSGILVDHEGRLWELEVPRNLYHVYAITTRQNAPSILRRIGSISARTFGRVNPGYTFTLSDKNRGWFAVDPVGLMEVDIQSGRVLRRFKPSEGLFDDKLRALLADREGNIWSGTWTAGLNVLHPGVDTFRAVKEFPGLPGSGVRSLHQDREGAVWIGTRYNGLVRFKGGTFTGLSVKDGLLSNAIWCIAETDQRIWCGTDVGMESVSKATGMLLPRKNDLIGQRVFACGAYRNEYVWAVLANSLVIIQDPETPSRGVPPPVYIKSFSVHGTVIPPEAPHKFSHDENSATIEYVGLSFRNERAVRYQYRMFGADSAWTAPSKQQSVTFASLTPGTYMFEVRAISADGVTSTTPASIRFVIIPPIWQRWWFVALTLLSLALVLFLLYRYRVARLLEMERLRTRIAADLHDDVGTNLSSIMLASQIIERELPLRSAERRHLAELRTRAGLTQDMLKDIVWLLNPHNDTMGDFILKLKEITRRHLMAIPWTFNVTGEQHVEGLSLEFKRNVILFLKEAVTNVAKHAEATAVSIDLTLGATTFSLSIEDNGKGFRMDDRGVAPDGDAAPVACGNGLTNLRTRAQYLGGLVEIVSAPGRGTTVRLVATMANTRSTARRAKSVD